MAAIKLKNITILALLVLIFALYSSEVNAPCCTNPFSTIFCTDLTELIGSDPDEVYYECCGNYAGCDELISDNCDYTSGPCQDGCCIIEGICEDYSNIQCQEESGEWRPGISCNQLPECEPVCCCDYDNGAQDIIIDYGACTSTGGTPNPGPNDDDQCSVACQQGAGNICGASAQTCTIPITNINPCYCGSAYMGSSSELEGYCCKGTPYLFSNTDYPSASDAQNACFADVDCSVPTYNISGIVMNIYGVPIIGVSLLASGVSTTTDNNGAFLLEGVAGGGYITLEASKENFVAKQQEVYVVSDVNNLEIVLESAIPYCALGEEIISECICENTKTIEGWCCLDGTLKENSSFCPESFPQCIENEYVSNNADPCRCGSMLFENPTSETGRFCCEDGTVAANFDECPEIIPFCLVGFPLDANDQSCRCKSPVSGAYIEYGTGYGGYCCEDGWRSSPCPSVLGPTCAQQSGTWCDITEICAVDDLVVNNPSDIDEHPNKRCCVTPDSRWIEYNRGVSVYSQDLLEVYACETPKTFCARSDCSNPITQNCQCGYGLAIRHDPLTPAYCCAADSMEFTSSTACYDISSSCRPPCDELGLGDVTQSPYGSCYCEGAIRTTGWCCSDDTWFNVANSGKCVVHEDTLNVRGAVTDCETGEPLNNITVNIRRPNPFWGDSYITGVTDPDASDGYYMIRNVPINHEEDGVLVESQYDIFGVRMLDYFTREIERTFSDNEKPIVTLDFCMEHLPYWNITGYVYDALNNSPINGAAVRLLTRTIPDVDPTITLFNGSLNGTFVLNNVIQGQHTLGFSLFPPYAPTRARVNLDQNVFLNISMYLYNCFTNKEMGLMMDYINATPHKQQLEVHWRTACQPTGFNLYRCEADSLEEGCIAGEDPSTVVIAADLNSSTMAYNDTTIMPDTVYCYRSAAEYDFPFIEEVPAFYIMGQAGYKPNEINPVSNKLEDGAMACFRTGPKECYLYEDEFCGSDTSRSTCIFDHNIVGGIRNSLVRKVSAPTQQSTSLSSDCTSSSFFDTGHKCIGPADSGKSYCSYKSDCDQCNTPFGLFHFKGYAEYRTYTDGEMSGVDSNKFCDSIPHCYKDTTETSVNRFFSCSEVSSCYDYKSESACTGQSSLNPDGTVDGRFNNKCLPRDCYWTYDERYENLGIGVCRELRLDELCPGDNDCDNFPDDATLGENQIPDSDSDGISDDGITYDFNLDGIVDYSEKVFSSIYADYAGSSYDIDDDNDMSPDAYDPDDNTFVDDVNQDCHLCDINGSDLVYEQCDRTRCMLFGSCYWDGSSCLQRSETTCQMFNKSDCTGFDNTQDPANITLDTIHNPLIEDPGRTGNTNRFTGLSNDYFNFGVCRWSDQKDSCFKDTDMDLEEDCKLLGDTGNCQLDMTPPETKVPHVIAYGAPLNISSFIDDYYTDNFRIYYCIGNSENPCYPDVLLNDMTYNIDDFTSQVTKDHPLFEDRFPLYAIDSSQRKEKIIPIYSVINTSLGDLKPSLIDAGTNPVETAECSYWKDSYEEVGLPDPGEKEFRCGDGFPDDGKFTFYFYVEDLGKDEIESPGNNPNNLEVVKNMTFRIDTSVPDVMVGIAQKANEVSVNPPVYNTDLVISLNLNEKAVCKSALRRVKAYDNKRFECFTESEMPLEFGDIGQIDPMDEHNNIGDYGNNWTLEFAQLPDGLYLFTYICEDQVHNKQCIGKDSNNPLCTNKQRGCTVDPGYGVTEVVRKKIWISSDPTFNIAPYDPVFNSSPMQIHLTAGNKFECVYSDAPEDFGEGYYNNNWTSGYCEVRSPFGWVKDPEITDPVTCSVRDGRWTEGSCTNPAFTSRSSCLRGNSPIDGVVFNDGVEEWENRYLELKEEGKTFEISGGYDSEEDEGIGGVDYLYDAYIPTDSSNEASLYKIICNTTIFGLREKNTFVGIDRQAPVTLFNYPGGLVEFDTTKWYNFKPTIQLDCVDSPIDPEMEFGCTELYYCINDEDCSPEEPAEDTSEIIFLDSDRTKHICYYSVDDGNNKGQQACDTIKIDRIKPIIYDIQGIPQVTNLPITSISAKVGNFLTSQYWYDNLMDSNGEYKQFNDLPGLEDFTLKESFKIGGYPVYENSLLGSFELVRFMYTGNERQQTERFYSIDVLAFEDRLTFILYKGYYRDEELQRTDIKTYTGFSYDLDRWYDSILKVNNNKVTFMINGQDIFRDIALTSIDGFPQPDGIVFIPQALDDDGNIPSNFLRSISKLGIQSAGEYSPLVDVKVLGNAYSDSPDNYVITGTLDDFTATVRLKHPGTNTFTITAKDFAGNLGVTDFNIYKDEFGPEIYPYIQANTTADKGRNWSISRVDSEFPGYVHAEYGKPIDIRASIIDERFTYLDTVRFDLHNNDAELLILNAGTLLENGGADLGTSGWNWNNAITALSSAGSQFSIQGYNATSDIIPISPGLPYTLSARLKGNSSVFVRWVLKDPILEEVGNPDCILTSGTSSFEYMNTTCEAPDDDWFGFAVVYISDSGEGDSVVDDIVFEQGIEPSPYYFHEASLQQLSNTIWNYTLEVAPGCGNTGTCEIPPGHYKALFKAKDTFGNPSKKATYFEVKDTVPARFSVRMSNPDGIDDYMIYGYNYQINFTSDSLLRDNPSFSLLINEKVIPITNIRKVSDYMYVTNKTIVGVFLENLDGAPGVFNPVTQDLQGTASSHKDVTHGKDFYIDTVGPEKPNLIYPTTDGGSISAGSSKVFVSGFYTLQNGRGGARIVLKVNDEDLSLPVTFRQWKDESSTTSMGDPLESDTGSAVVMVLEDAQAGSDEVIVNPDYADLFIPGMYASFHRNPSDKGYRSDGQYYLIEDFVVDETAGTGTLVISPPLERNITGGEIIGGQPVGGDTIKVYEGNAPQGWFGAELNLLTGQNYIYAFSLDEHNVPSKEVEFIVVRSDPYPPMILPSGPEDGLRTPSDTIKISANISENISSILSIRMTINSILPGADTQRFTECNNSGCSYGSWSIRGNKTHKALVYDPEPDGYIDGIHTITIYATDEVGNTGSASWGFQKDGGLPFNPIINLTPGEFFENVAYSTSPNKAEVIFLADQGKIVNASKIEIKDPNGAVIFTDPDPTLKQPYDLSGVLDVDDIDENYISVYEIDLLNLELDKTDYVVIATASKLKNFTDGKPEWSDEIETTAKFVVDTTPPVISVIMQNPTMLKAPKFKIMTDDPSTCFFETDEQQESENTTFIGMAREFNASLEEHSFDYDLSQGRVISNPEFYDGKHTITITCENILGSSSSTDYEFLIIPPNRDRVYYRKGQKINLYYKTGIKDMSLIRGENFNLDFSEIAGNNNYGISYEGEGIYKITYTIPSSFNRPFGQYMISSSVTYDGKTLTDMPVYVYIHDDTMTPVDVDNAFQCYNHGKGNYFDELDCSWAVDYVHTNTIKNYDGYSQIKTVCETAQDGEDTNCQAVFYEFRSDHQVSSAVNWDDPEENGIGIACFRGGNINTGYCNTGKPQYVQVYYTAAARKGGKIKLRFIQEKPYSDEYVRLYTKGFGPEFNLLPSETLNSQLPVEAVDTYSPGCHVDTCSQVQYSYGDAKGSADNLDETVEINIPNTPAVSVGAHPEIGVTGRLGEDLVLSETIALAEFRILGSTDYDPLTESGYTDGDLHPRCIDGRDNDLDSGETKPTRQGRDADQLPSGFDCRDQDCNGVVVADAVGSYRGTVGYTSQPICQFETETVCNDAFDNDQDRDFDQSGLFDFRSNTGIDCRDPNCDARQGHPTDSNINCEYQREESCSDGFDNDAMNRKDCDMSETRVGTGTPQPTAETAEYDCAAYCKANDDKGASDENTGELCRDNLDNDWDFMVQSGASGYSINNAVGAGIDCRWQNPDEDCDGVIVSFDGNSGACELGAETSCNDGFDNDFDHENNGRQKPGWELNPGLYETLFGKSLETAADCDDYDCFGIRENGIIICTENRSNTDAPQELTCNDNIDNDLDGLKDCLDPDCNGRQGIDSSGKTGICEFGNETFCSDEFDNDGNEGTDSKDPDCKGGFCYYPTPEVENITIDSCMLNTPDEDVNEKPNCEDPSCAGRVCSLNSKCLQVSANGCRVVTSITEICDDVIDNDGDGNIDCLDPDCSSNAEMCGTRVINPPSNWIVRQKGYAYDPGFTSASVAGKPIGFYYKPYVHAGDYMEFRFTGNNVPVPNIFIGDLAKKLDVFSNRNDNLAEGLPSGMDYVVDTLGVGFNIKGDSTYSFPNLIMKSKVKEAAQLGITGNTASKVYPSMLKASAQGEAEYTKDISIRVLEKTKTTITMNDIIVHASADRFQLMVSKTDPSDIAYCEFRIEGVTSGWVRRTDCIYESPEGISNERTYSIDLRIADGSANIAESTGVKTITLKNLKQESEMKFIGKSHKFFTQDEKLSIKQEFSVPVTLAPPTIPNYAYFSATSCRAQIYDEDHNIIGGPIALTFESESNQGVCYGEIDLSGLDNQSSYSVGIIIKRLNDELAGEEKQLFVCRYSQDPESGQYRCMDECQLTKGLPFIEITEPEEDGLVITYPKIPVKGNTIQDPFALVEIFVNSLTESQYQVEVAAGFFNSTAMVLSKGDNTVIARVTDKDQLTNTDDVSVFFDGVNVERNIDVVGLPRNITEILTIISVLETGEILDPNGTEIRIYYESPEGDQEILISTAFENNTFISIPQQQEFDPGDYRIEVIPKMQSGEYGVGKLFRFNYCPDGTEIRYNPLPASRTSNSTVLFTGTMTPQPDKADLFIIKPDGSKTLMDITPAIEAFSISYEDIIDAGINTYYIRTEYQGIVCQDIKRSIMLDTEFEGVKKVLIEGQCYDDSDCDDGFICINGRCIDQAVGEEEQE